MKFFIRIVARIADMPPFCWLISYLQRSKEMKLATFNGTFEVLAKYGITDGVGSEQYNRVLNEFQAEISNGTGPADPKEIAIFVCKRANVRADGREPSDRELAEMFKAAGFFGAHK